MSEVRKKKRYKELKEWVIAILIMAAAIFVIRSFIFGTVIVKGVSMEPTYYHGDLIAINKLSYHFSSPERGDIIVCDYGSIEEEKIIKRVIGLPGEVIDFVPKNNGNYDVMVNGETLDEDYIKSEVEFYGDTEYPYTVPENCYFVMGDNRNNSTDSRWQSIGFIEKNNIEGKAFLKIWHFGR